MRDLVFQKRSMLIALLLFVMFNSNAQCPPGYCNPNTATAYISRYPQCYGDNYEVTTTGQFDIGYFCNAVGNYFLTNQVFEVAPGSSICLGFDSYCFTYLYDATNNICNLAYDDHNDVRIVNLTLPLVPCNISAAVSTSDASGFGCSDGSVTITGTTNACNGYYAIIDGYGDIGSALSGVSLPTVYLPAGNYTAHIYSLPSGCEETQTFTIQQPPCKSPYIIDSVPASAYGCPNGNILLTNNVACNVWSSQLSQFVPGNIIFYFSNGYAGGLGTVISVDNYTGGLLSGIYYIKSTTAFTNNVGQSFQCEVWDTIFVGPPCQFTAAVSNITNAASLCDGSFCVNATTNACNGYNVTVTTLAGNPVSSQTGNSGVELTFSGLPFGTYIVHSYPNSISPVIDCERYDTVHIQDLGCHSPYSIATTATGGYGCNNGNILITNNSICNTWYSQLYQFHTGYNIFNFYNYYAGGVGSVIDVNIYTGGLPSGIYYLKSSNSVTNFDGVALTCEVWDTIFVGPPCQFTAAVSNITNAASLCDGSFKVNATTNACNGYNVTVTTLAGNPVSSQSGNSGVELTFSGLPFGTYIVHSYPNSISPVIDCERYDTVYIQDLGCHSPYSIATTAAGGYGCNNGNILLTNNSICNTWYSQLYQFNTGYNIFNFYNYYAGGVGSVIDVNIYTGGLPSGIYYLKSSNSVTNFDGVVLTCEVWDTIVVGPPCQLTVNSFQAGMALGANNCADGSISVNATINDCNGYNVIIKKAADNTVVATVFNIPSNITATVGSLPAGDYIIGITGASAGGDCSWVSGIVTVSCDAMITVNLKLFLQGYYTGNGAMQPVLNNQAVPLSQGTETDRVSIELHDPLDYTLNDTKEAILLTDGTVSATFARPAGPYYIAIKHRNTIQTWTAGPVACTTATPLYDFTTAAGKAFENNQVQVEPGVWAFFTGDINQDEYIDGNDFPQYDTESASGGVFDATYTVTDMNGDGFVDGNDFPVYDLNSSNGVSSIHP